MNETNSRHRHWRLIVAVSALVLGAVIVWLVWYRPPMSMVERAQPIEVGWHISEVEKVMGGEGFVFRAYDSKEIRMYGHMHQTWMEGARAAEHVTGESLPQPAIKEFPVVVWFDPRSGKVFRIKRGDDMVGTPHSPW